MTLLTEEIVIAAAQAWIDHDGDDKGRAALEAAEPLISARQREASKAALADLRDLLVSTSDDTGSYLVAAILERAIDIIDAEAMSR